MATAQRATRTTPRLRLIRNPSSKNMGAGDKAPMITGFRSETVMVDGLRLHYWLGGNPEGQPVILWHGFLGTGYAWRDVAPALAETGLAVLAPDMRGYGDSDKPA